MKPTERIVIHLNQKAPFQAAHRYGEVTQKSMSRWGENTVNIDGSPPPPCPATVPAARIPALRLEQTAVQSDGLHQMPQVTKAIDVHTQNLGSRRRARARRVATRCVWSCFRRRSTTVPGRTSKAASWPSASSPPPITRNCGGATVLMETWGLSVLPGEDGWGTPGTPAAERDQPQ